MIALALLILTLLIIGFAASATPTGRVVTPSPVEARPRAMKRADSPRPAPRVGINPITGEAVVTEFIPMDAYTARRAELHRSGAHITVSSPSHLGYTVTYIPGHRF